MKSVKTMARRRSILIDSLALALCCAAVISIVQCNSIQQQTETKPKQPAAELASGKANEKELDAKSIAIEPTKSGELTKTAAESISAEQLRKGRSEAPPTAGAAASELEKVPAPAQSTAEGAKQSGKAAAPPAASATTAASSSQSKPTGKSQHSTSGSALTGKKLPANLGTVTSTGSGGPTHYKSQHDTYSAIAEKHGALESAAKKANKRNHVQRFGGIQKASGFTDSLNPFKTVTDGGLARTLGASMRSIMKGKYSIPAYVASAVLGAVALMAFYESPISPLPVPALPEPPVGRFPPEMPVISQNLAVPFRMNGQQQGQQQYGQQQYGGQNGYANQRSFQATNPIAPNQQQPVQQVLFPGATAQSAQQRQGSVAPGPVQQLAANLISTVSGKQTAQRKSGLDLESVSSRSFLGGSNKQLGSPANQQQHHKQGGFLSYFGLGGGSQAATSGAAQNGQQQSTSGQMGDIHRASNSHSSSSSPTHDQLKVSLSNSHLVNKMKSYFDRPVPHSSWSMDHNVPNQYDQYRKMSFMDALSKDTAFLSSFFSPSRRSSNSTSMASPSAATSSIQQSINAVLGGASAGLSTPTASQQVASSRMQVDPLLSSFIPSPFANTNQPAQAQTKRASSGFGLVKAAFDTLMPSMLHRSSSVDGSKKTTAAFEEQQQQHNAAASTMSLLNDLLTSYNAASQAPTGNSQQYNQQTPQQAEPSKQQLTSVSAGQANADQVSGRSADSVSVSDKSSPAEQPAVKTPQSSVSQAAPEPQQSQVQPQQQQPQPQQLASSQPLSRKVRSIGLDYPMGQQQLQYQQQQQQHQQQQQPSRASQINSLVDYVSDSYKQNKLLINLVMNQVGLSQAMPYVEQLLDDPKDSRRN